MALGSGLSSRVKSAARLPRQCASETKKRPAQILVSAALQEAL